MSWPSFLPGETYAAGLAHALNKKVIALQRKSEKPRKLLFDVEHQRVPIYEAEAGNLQRLLNRWIPKRQRSKKSGVARAYSRGR
jgi:hypothetical protein